MIDLLSNTYFIGVLAIMLNGIATGFAVYVGTHIGKKAFDNEKILHNKKDFLNQDDKKYESIKDKVK